jgi:membrane fusion protein, heavy metal efflux system
MNSIRFSRPLVAIALIITATVAGYLSRPLWWPASPPTAVPDAKSSVSNVPSNKIIVGDQAQKNLGLTAKPLQAGTFWKTITVPGMVVDRPGVSDREVVAPAIGTISQLWRVPGDTVHPGDVLFTLKLASEPVHEAQTGLFKASQDIKLAESRRDRLAAAGEGIAKARVIEAENDVTRLQTTAKAYREQLRLRAFSSADIAGIEEGKLATEISIVVPTLRAGNPQSTDSVTAASRTPPIEQPLAYEVQSLMVEVGEQVQAGQTMCHLSSHKSLAIEGRAFRDETTLLERSIQQGWPVDVDFREEASSDWPPIDQIFLIRYIANTIDPATRTFAFLMPLENQYKTVNHGNRTQILWRFRPGQKVLLRVRTEKLDDVFVLPADAVVFEGADAFVFIQNVNTFERKSIHVLFRDRDQVVLANDGALPTYLKGKERWTIPAVARTAAAQLNRMAKAGSSAVPAGYHIHADGSLHKNEDEGKK